jgi:hypothetical protein
MVAQTNQLAMHITATKINGAAQMVAINPTKSFRKSPNQVTSAGTA